jgi:prefoldin subunit 4
MFAGLPILILLCLQKEKEDLDDISNELELADEDDKIPYVD